MKKIFSLSLALFMALALAACGGHTEENPTNTNMSAPLVSTTQTNPPVTTAPPTTNPIPTTTAHTHTWADATCTTPKTCGTCGATSGDALGHTWSDATCTAPKTCSACKTTEGKAAGHSWTEATCTSAKTCSRCNITDGSPLGHSWNEATCTSAKICSRCNIADGSPLGHSWNEATCTSAKTCASCSVTEGSALGHSWSNATCTSAKTCSVCSKTEGSALGHSWNEATCTSAKTCSVCKKTEGSALGHIWAEATCTSPKTCSRCQATEGAALKHAYTATKIPATCTAPGYTTYVCQCGDSYVADYVNGAHNYQKYVCTACGQIDKAHAYEYLIEWVKANGVADGSHVNFDYYLDEVEYSRYGLTYDATGKYLYINQGSYYNGKYFGCALYLDNYSIYMSYEDITVRGYIDAAEFTANSPITNVQYQGNTEYKWDMIEVARLTTCGLIDWLRWCLDAYNVGITIADLGLSAF